MEDKVKLIKLTFYRPANKYGGKGGTTEKEFYFNPSTIVSMVQYHDSTKIVDITGEKFEVCETLLEVIKLINI